MEMSFLVERKMENAATISSFSITQQAAWKYNKGQLHPEDDSDFIKRQQLAKENLEIDKQILAINNQLKECYLLNDSDKNKKLMEIFNETFTKEQLTEIRIEAERRMAGKHPFKLSFNVG